MKRPLIQIDDEIREMTEEEHADYLAAQNNTATMPSEPTDP